jgi:hypothetical protein
MYLFKNEEYCDECGELILLHLQTKVINNKKDEKYYPQYQDAREESSPYECCLCKRIAE